MINGRSYYYILDGHEAVTVPDMLTWGQWWETADRRGAVVSGGDAGKTTVFLSMDHNFGGRGAPLLFETMVFGGPLDEEQERYADWSQAEQGHKRMVKRVRAILGKGQADA